MILNYHKYYKEIKNRIVLTIISWTSCFSVCYFYKETILFTLINTSNAFYKLTEKPYFIFTDLTEIFYIYIELSLFLSNQTILFISLYHSFMFLASGLYKFEFVRLKLILQIFIATWVVAFFLLSTIIIPFSWNFFLSFQESSNALQPVSFFFEAKIIEYFHHYTSLYYVSLVNCQFLAVVLLTLTSINKNLKKTKTFRKLFYFVFIIFSTVTTPPDIGSQIFIAGSFIVFFEFFILLKQIKTNMATN